MAKRTLETVDVKIGDKKLNEILQAIADAAYWNPCRVAVEFVQNSVDSAKELKAKNGGKYPYPIEIKVNLGASGELQILDNCGGMDLQTLTSLVGNALGSGKRKKKGRTSGIGGGNGFGVHCFRSCFEKATYKTREKGRTLLEMELVRGAEGLRGIEIRSLEGDEEGFPHESGTLIELSGFSPTSEKTSKPTRDEMVKTLSYKFEGSMMDPTMRISVLEDWSGEEVCDNSKRPFHSVRFRRIRV